MGRKFLLIGVLCLVAAMPGWADDAVVNDRNDKSGAAGDVWYPPSAIFEGERGQTSQGGEVLLTVTAFCGRNCKGQVIAALFCSKKDFLEKPCQRLAADLRADGTAQIKFSGLETGDYAVTVFNDKNMNDELDKNILGVPKELYGISNDIRPSVRRPKWEEAKFRVETPRTGITIRLAPYKLMTSRTRRRPETD